MESRLLPNLYFASELSPSVFSRPFFLAVPATMESRLLPNIYFAGEVSPSLFSRPSLAAACRPSLLLALLFALPRFCPPCWLTHYTAARLAVRNHMPLAECAHFGQHRTAQAVYDAVVARHSSPATTALDRLMLPYLSRELSAFAIVEDLGTHLRTSDARYRAALLAEFLDRNPPLMNITLYFIHLLAAETSVVAVGAARGTPHMPFFEGCSPSPLAPSYASTAAVDVLGGEDVGGSGSCPYVIRMGDCAEFGDEVERPRWAELLRSGVAIFYLVYDTTPAAMYALSVSAEGDCLCVPPDPSIEATSLGASESSLPRTAPLEALHTFTLDSGASRCLFRDSTTLTPLSAPVPVRLADPSEGPVLARSSTVLPCPAVPSGSLSSLHLPSFSTNLVSTAALQDAMVTTTTPGARVSGHGRERYFLLVVDDYTRYTTVFPLRSKGQVVDVLIPWIHAVCLQLRERFHQELPVLCLHSDRGGEFSSDLLQDFCRGEGILQSFMLPASPQQNGIAERRIGLVMEVPRTSMIHAAAPHFLWPFAVRYAAHQLNLWTRVSLPETSATLHWTGEVGDASVLRVWGSRAFVRDTSAVKLSAHSIPCIFLGFSADTPGWQFYHPTSCRAFPSQDVTFDESIPFYRLFPHRSAPAPPPPLFLAPAPPPVDPLPPQGPAPSGAASRGAEPGGAEPGGAEHGGAEYEGAGSWGAEPRGAKPAGVESERAEPEGPEPLSLQQLREWLTHRKRFQSGATGAGDSAVEDIGAGGAGVTAGAGGTGGAAAAGPGGARTSGRQPWMPRWPPRRPEAPTVKRPSGSLTAFKARYVARGFSQRQGVDYFQTFSPTPKMTTLRVLLHVAAHCDHELHSLDFSTAFLQGSMHEKIWLRRPTSLHWLVSCRTMLAALGFTPSTTDPSLFLRTDTSLLLFYVLVYVLQRFGFQFSSPQPTPLSTSHSLSAPPSDEPVEPSGPHPKLVDYLMYLMTCTRPDLAYPLSLLARYVAPALVVRLRSTQGPWLHRSYASSPTCEMTWASSLVRLQTKHIALRYFLAQELQQRGQLRLAYVATRANTGDIFTKALQSGDHQHFCTVLGLVPTLPHSLTT
ncbi:unnamed protein product [Closterium sp. NIES-53]